MTTLFHFCKSGDGSKVHVRKTDESWSVCGSVGGTWSGTKKLTKGDKGYPIALTDICKNCRISTIQGVRGFIMASGITKTPEAVKACVFIDINLPTNSEIPISEARVLVQKISDEIGRFEKIDSDGFCVKFNVRTY